MLHKIQKSQLPVKATQLTMIKNEKRIQILQRIIGTAYGLSKTKPDVKFQIKDLHILHIHILQIK